MKIGGGWNKTTDEGKEFISISINKDISPLIVDDTKFLSLFINEHKEAENHPDWNFIMRKKED